jgi:hypothetical protein
MVRRRVDAQTGAKWLLVVDKADEMRVLFSTANVHKENQYATCLKIVMHCSYQNSTSC